MERVRKHYADLRHGWAALVLASLLALAGIFAFGSIIAAFASPPDARTGDQDPIGTIQLYAGSSDPGNGWLIADGRALSRTAYPELYSVTGTLYGSGDGSTTFNLPDLRGRAMPGKGSHTSVDSLAESDGSALVNRSPKHQHTVYDPSHNHTGLFSLMGTPAAGGSYGGSSVNRWGSDVSAHMAGVVTGTSTTGLKVNPEAASSSSAPQNSSSFIALRYIIKVAESSGTGDTDPVGSVQAYAGSGSDPGSGWVLADGRAVSRSSYSSLFSAASTSFGSGDGSTTFNLPDLRGRVPVGVGSHADVDALGESDGAALAARRPAHQHSVYDPGHSHTGLNNFRGYGLANGQWGGSGVYGPGGNVSAHVAGVTTGSRSTSVKVNPEGASSSSAPVDEPSYLAVRFVIKLEADGGSADSDPLGSIQGYAGGSDPENELWLLADGRARSRTTSATLFAVTGASFGSGDGSSTFNLPDLRGRVPVGVGSHADVDTLGESDGAALSARRPAHQHSVYDPVHYHTGLSNFMGTPAANGGGGNGVYGPGSNISSEVSSVYTGWSSTGIKVNPTASASSSAPSNSSAFQVANYIVKDSNDRRPPSPTWGAPSSPTSAASLEFTLSFDEPVTGLTAGDITNTGTATGCSFSVSGSGSSYTVTASSCSEGSVSPRLAADSVTDESANVGPSVAVSGGSPVTVDRTAPAVSWSSLPSSPSGLSTLTYGLSFSETVIGLTGADISNQGTATGCSFSLSGSSSPYTVTVSSCSEGTVILRLASGAASDEAGNSAPASSLDAASVTIDRTPPVITWGTTPASPNNSASLTYQINFNENVTGLTAADFSNVGTATGCVFTPSSDTGSTLSVAVSSCSEGTLALRLGSAAVSDAAGNTAPASAMDAASVTIDRTGPSASWSSVPASPTSSASLSYELSFSEPITGLTAGDITNTGTASGCSFSLSGSSSPYTVTVSSCSGGTVVLRLSSGAVSDSAGNTGPGSGLAASSVTVDRTAPAANWSEPSSPSRSASLSYGLSFSETVTGLTAGDISNQGTATGCSISVSGSGSSYTVTADSCSEGTVILRLASGAVSDEASNVSATTNASPVTVDRTAPSLSFSQVPDSPTSNSALTYELTASEDLSGLTAGDISNQGTATGCSIAVSGSSSPYTVNVSSCSEGTVVLRLAAGSVSDEAGNTAPASNLNASSVTIDRTAPSLSWSQVPASPTSASPLTYELTASEALSGLTAADISNEGSATGCSISVSGANSPYAVSVSGCSDGTVVLRLASGSVSDEAGNTAPASSLDASSVTVDGAPATATWTEPNSPTNNSSLAFTLSFSKPVNGLTSADLSNAGTATGCSFSVSGSGDSYAVTASSCSQGTLVLRLASGSVSTSSGISSPAAASSASPVTIDRTAPAASWSSVPASPTGADSLEYELTFSEAVSGLTAEDLSNTGTAAGCSYSVSGSGDTYTVTASGCSSGSLILRLAAGSVVDEVSNSGPASAVSASSVTIALIPVNSEPPSITGTPETGQSLTASPGTWSRSPSYAYQWQSSADGSTGWSDISGATSSTYTIASAQAGSYMRVKVTATNAVGSAVAYSEASSPVADAPQNPVSPAISGDPYPGDLLTLSTGTWTGSPAPTLAYQWQYCDADGLNCQDIEGETSLTYTVQESDLGYRIRVQVTGTNASGQLSAYSAPTAEISNQAPSPPALQSDISITAEPEAGQQATTDGGTWSGYPEPTLTYQWQVCEIGGECADVPSQQAALDQMNIAGRERDFTPTVERAGKQLRVMVTATNSEGAVSEVSARSGGVRARPFKITNPSFAGAAAVNQMLIASPGSWGGYPAPSFTYAWKLCDKDGENCAGIAGTTGGYRGQAGHVGKRMRFTVTATNTLGSESADSAASSPVQGAPVNTVLPEISGTVTSGQTLTVSDGTWSSDPEATYTYQWQRCDAALKRCGNVVGSTLATYPLSALDAGVRIRARVTATNLRGQTSVFTAATAPTTASVEMVAGPGIAGVPVVGRSVAAVAGKWTGFPAPTFAFQWQRCDQAGDNCVDLADKTANGYALVAADYGKRLRLKVTASNASSSREVYSAASAVVGAPPLLQEEPEIVGEAKLGETLGVDEGTWESATTPSYAYQWQQCDAAGNVCKDVRRATGEQFQVGTGQVGATMKVKVVSKNHLGAASADTDPTERVEGQPTSVGAPAIGGAAVTRSTLTTSAGAWAALPAATYSYQWQRCKGIECTDIEGATDTSYTATRDDLGFRLRSQVTAENELGRSTSSSGMTAQVRVAIYTLSLDVKAGGRIRSVHNGVFCQGKCKMLVPEGTQVRLEPEPQTGYVFDTFSGDTCSGESCSFEMTGNAAIGAQFMPSPKMSLSYSLSQENIFLWEQVTVNLTARVTPPTETIRSQPGVRACIVLPDTLTAPNLPEEASLVGKNLCWYLGEVTPPYERELSVTLQARNRTGARSLTPFITAINREVVRGTPSSGTGFIKVSLRR